MIKLPNYSATILTQKKPRRRCCCLWWALLTAIVITVILLLATVLFRSPRPSQEHIGNNLLSLQTVNASMLVTPAEFSTSFTATTLYPTTTTRPSFTTTTPTPTTTSSPTTTKTSSISLFTEPTHQFSPTSIALSSLLTTSTTSTASTSTPTQSSITSPVESSTNIVSKKSHFKRNIMLGLTGLGVAAIGSTATHFINKKKYENALNLQSVQNHELEKQTQYQIKQLENHRREYEDEVNELKGRKTASETKVHEAQTTNQEANAHLLYLQQTLGEARTRLDDLMDSAQFHETNVNRIKTNIAGLEPRIKQENDQLKLTLHTLVQCSTDLQSLNKKVCVLNDSRKLDLVRHIILVYMWQEVMKGSVTSTTEKAVKFVLKTAINVAVSEAIDYFEVGGYLASKFKKMNFGFTTHITRKVDYIKNLNVLKQWKIGDAVIQQVQPTTKIGMTVTKHVAETSWLSSLTGLGQVALGNLMSPEEKVNLAMVKRNTVFRQMQSGWDKAEIMTVINSILDSQLDYQQWAVENGYTEVVRDCEQTIKTYIY